MVRTQWLILPRDSVETCDTQKSVRICNEFSKDSQTILVIQVISSRNDKNIYMLFRSWRKSVQSFSTIYQQSIQDTIHQSASERWEWIPVQDIQSFQLDTAKASGIRYRVFPSKSLRGEASEARYPVFLSKILSMVSSISHPIVLSTALVQDSTLWIDSRWQNQIRNSWSEARISQNTSLPRESDSQIYVKEARYTPQCDKGLWGLTTTLSSVQVPVNLEDDPDEPLSPFLQCRHHACDLSCF